MKERSGTVAHADDASAPPLIDHLRIEQRGSRHPAGLGRGACGLEAWRVVAKVELHIGELFPRVGYIMTNLETDSQAVVRF